MSIVFVFHPYYYVCPAEYRELRWAVHVPVLRSISSIWMEEGMGISYDHGHVDLI